MAEFQYTPAQRRALELLSGPAHSVMLFGGSRSGKTFVLCCALVVRALRAPGSRHAIIRRHFNGVRSAVGRDTMPKVLSCRFAGKLNCEYNKTDSVFTLPNRSEIWLIGLDDAARAEKILGKEFSTIYFNECSELDYSSIQTALTRLAQKAPPLENKAFFDCNPPGRSHWTHRVFLEKLNPADRTPLVHPEDYDAMLINPSENAVNLPPGYIENTLAGLPRRQRERFLEGKWLDEIEGGLWTHDLISKNRVLAPPCPFVRVVIGVDPAVTNTGDSDCTGIVGAALGTDGEYYILADRSCREAPLNWGKRVIELYEELEADRVVGEVNNGGDLIEGMLRRLSPELSFHAVRATRGKLIRAEPAAALYEKGKVHHVGEFPELEEEMTSFSPLTSAKSPDRMDALVWALAELADSGNRFILADG